MGQNFATDPFYPGAITITLKAIIVHFLIESTAVHD